MTQGVYPPVTSAYSASPPSITSPLVLLVSLVSLVLLVLLA